MNQRADDLMVGAPAHVKAKQLRQTAHPPALPEK